MLFTFSSMQLKTGTYLQGDKYRIIDTLGNGGFGITYLAEHELAGRNVCIKEFFPKEFYNRDDNSCSISLGSKGSADIMEAYKAKFIKEAKTIARLDHSNIIHIHDVFTENNTAYYVMDYVDGVSLHTLVKNRGALQEQEAIAVIRAIAKALAYIHDRKIMHLDIKPANIMLRREDGRAILIDFGLSKQYDADGNQTSSTPVGISHGYAPMEQYKQGGVNEFSPETDIYSLGATLYYLVTGNVPPQAATIVDEGLPILPDHLSNATINAIEKSMEVQRRRRPHTMSEFLAILDDKSCAEHTSNKSSNSASTAISEETLINCNINLADDRTIMGDDFMLHKGEWIDLGLSVKWATCNVGAKRPEQHGNYYAWGEISPKASYMPDNCSTSDMNLSDISRDNTHDAAMAHCGANWRMPTNEEFNELIDKCDWMWTTQNDVKGYKVTSKINGNSIFLPATGCRYGEELYNSGSNGNYWSSTPCDTNDAYALYFSFGHHYTHWYNRYRGRSVRPVYKK